MTKDNNGINPTDGEEHCSFVDNGKSMVGKWNYRRRRQHRHLQRMATGSMLGLFPVLMMVFLGLWWDVHCTGYFSSDEYMDKCFQETVERVVPHLEAYRSEHGRLPDSLCVEGLVKNWKNSYFDTTRGNFMGIIYYPLDDSAYAIVHIDRWAKYVLAPKFEGYVFYHWDEDGDSVRVDTVFRQQNK